MWWSSLRRCAGRWDGEAGGQRGAALVAHMLSQRPTYVEKHRFGVANSTLERCPIETLVEICAFLAARDLCALACTSVHMRNVMSCEVRPRSSALSSFILYELFIPFLVVADRH